MSKEKKLDRLYIPDDRDIDSYSLKDIVDRLNVIGEHLGLVYTEKEEDYIMRAHTRKSQAAYREWAKAHGKDYKLPITHVDYLLKRTNEVFGDE